jgi:hypothetical protein
MSTRIKAVAYRLAAIAFPLLVLCGFRCPAQGCPACKMLGK